jgi:hypothetical protein
MIRQRLAFGLGLGTLPAPIRPRWNGFLWLGLFIARQFAAPAFEFFQREFKLGDRFVHLFGTTTELHAPEFGDDELEVFDFGLLRTDQCLEQGGVVGQESAENMPKFTRLPPWVNSPVYKVYIFIMRISGVSRCVPDDASRCLREAWKVAPVRWTEPSVACGQMKRPRSRRLAKRHSRRHPTTAV